MKKLLAVFSTMIVCIYCYSQTKGSQQKDDLYTGFTMPPNAAKPRVWWHWMNGNITKDGIRKDLEWMHRSGVGGFQNFDASLMTPQIVKQRLTYMTPDWIDAFRFTTKLADSLKLEMAIAGSPGWSESGGPWVKPENGMKKIVWKELRVKGGTSRIKIDAPSGTTGPFQNIPKQSDMILSVERTKLPVFYKDVAVIAFKLPATDQSLAELGAVVSSSGGNFTLDQLTDGDLATSHLLPRDSINGYAWIQFAFPQPQTIKAITMVGGGKPGLFGRGGDANDARALEAIDDGIHFRLVCHIPIGSILQQTIAIPETRAACFRITVRNPPAQGNPFQALVGVNTPPVTPPGTEIAEIVLHSASRIQMFEEKDAFAPATGLYEKATAPANDPVALNDVIDLTHQLNADGTLNWTAPSGGEWKIIRFGYSLLGIDNHPASPEATGPEVDKLDPLAIRDYFTNYLNQYKKATGGLMGDKGGLQYIITDSWEAGAQNWTGNMPAEFHRRRGYSMIPWMPVLTGHIVKSAEASEQFLFDFRKTLSDMVAEYHYDGLTRILKEYGMKRYSESHENGRALIADGMEVKRTAAVPMSALWTPNIFINHNDQTAHTMDIRESASVSHIYGQNLVAAESLTALGVPAAAWIYDPQSLKPSADLELASGLNRFVIHCSVHQPVDDKIPGLGLGPFGQWFNRHETWAEQAMAWTTYLSRSSYLLQQGKFVADIVYYYGEDNNITALFGKKPPEVPEGYNYDFINADALINLLTVKEGKLVTPSGMTYRLLVLDSNARKMSLPVLRKLNALVKAGAIITGVRPESTPSLSDDQSTFKTLTDEIWNTRRANVLIDKPLKEVLTALNIVPDFAYTKPATDTRLLYVHRKLADGDLYWVNNRNDKNEALEASFRITGREPELWHAETGVSEKVAYKRVNGVTSVQLSLTPNDAVFVVFRKKATTHLFTQPAAVEKILATINGPWQVHFQKDRGAPESINMNELVSFTTHADPGIKYFSGTATYHTTLTVDKTSLASQSSLWLDLGEVKNLAEVTVNGKTLGIVWKQPFRVNLKDVLKAGDNAIDIKVTNLWVNRLIGDAQPDVVHKITYTTMPFYQANSKLLPSGLLGPVKLLSVTQ